MTRFCRLMVATTDKDLNKKVALRRMDYLHIVIYCTLHGWIKRSKCVFFILFFNMAF